MAKKKSKSKKSSGKKRSTKKNQFVNTDKLMGLAAMAWGMPKLEAQLNKIDAYNKLSPKVKAGIKVVAGEWLPHQSFAKNIGNPAIRQGAGDAMIYEGLKELLSSLGVSGLAGDKRKVRGNEYLAVSIEGLNDTDIIHEDVLSDDMNGADDLDTVNDDMGEEVIADDMSDDFEIGEDDLSTVNDDLDL